MYKILAIQNQIRGFGGGAIAQDIIVNNYSINAEIELVNIDDFIQKNTYGKYGFNLRLFAYISRILVKNKTSKIVIGQYSSRLTILFILLLFRRRSFTHVVHTAEYFCMNSLCTLPNKKPCEGKIGAKCVRNGCVKRKSQFFAYYYRRLEIYFLKHICDEFIVLSEFMKTKLFESGFKNISVKKLEMNRLFENWQSKDEKQHIDNKPCDILFVGVLEWHKGLIEAYEGFKLAVDRGLDCSVNFHIVGEGGLSRSLNDMVISDSLNQRVFLHGNLKREELKRIYENVNVVLFPSYFETLGLVALEARVHNKHIIVSDRGSLREVLSDYPLSNFLESIKPDSIVSALSKIYGLNEK